jgi:hypothetical protein
MKDLKNTLVIVNHGKTASALIDAIKVRQNFEVKESPQGAATFFERRGDLGVFGITSVSDPHALKNQMTWVYRELGVQTVVLTGALQGPSGWSNQNAALVPDVCVVPVEGSTVPSNLVLYEEFFFDSDVQHRLRSTFNAVNQSGPSKVLATDQSLSPEALAWSAEQLGVPFAEPLSGRAFKAAQFTSQKVGAIFCDDSNAALKSLTQAWISALGWDS